MTQEILLSRPLDSVAGQHLLFHRMLTLIKNRNDQELNSISTISYRIGPSSPKETITDGFFPPRVFQDNVAFDAGLSSHLTNPNVSGKSTKSERKITR